MSWKDYPIFQREDKSFVIVINEAPYHVPNEGEWVELYAEVADFYANNESARAEVEFDYTDLHPEPTPPEPTFEEQIEAAYADFDARVVARLNTFAATRRYSSINSACSYSNSTDPQFRLEGEYCVQARDATYRKCYDLLEEYMPDVLAGTRPIPTWEEIEAQLPPLVWPDE